MALTVPHSERLLLRVEEAAAVVGLSRAMLYELVRVGAIRSVKVGRATRIPRAALEEWVQRLESEAGADA